MPLRFARPAPEAPSFPLTIRHLLDTAMITARDQEIVYRDQLRMSYRDFRGRIGRLASALAALGVEQGMTVAVMDWDSHRYLEAYFAVPMMGAVLQTVNVRIPPAQICYTLEHAEAEVLLVHRDFFPLAEAMLPSLPQIKAIVAIMDGAGDALPDYAVGEYETLSAAASPDFPFEDFDENAVATTFYTSGTTGNPKGVCFTHRQLVLHTMTIKGVFGASTLTPPFGAGDVYMPLTPMFHVHAWGMPYLATMLGMKQVYPGRYEPAMICNLRREHQATYSHCVPTVLRMVLDAAETTGVDLSGWKMTIGGSALSHALFEEARERGMSLVAGYGMSETCPTIALSRRSPGNDGSAHDDADDFTAAGVPVPLVSARVVNEAMEDVPHDGLTRGELVLRAPWLTPCYTKDEAASAELWRGGWLHTQDIATMDANGTIRIRDRIKDVIKTGGEWVDSILIEDLLGSVEGVREVSVIAVPDARWGERPLALIVADGGATLSLDQLNAPILAIIATGEISRYAKLDRFEFVSELPRTSVGKIDKKLLRERHSTAAPNA
jgi:fatty-acyl-CoA synthase